MNKRFRISIPVLLAVIFLVSCGAQSNEQIIANSVMNTMVGLNVQSSKTAVALNEINQATGTAAAAFPSPTFTPATFTTPTPETIWLTLLENTNCRQGPGDNYPLTKTLLKDEKVQVTGRTEENGYYRVTLPDSAGTTCWVWSAYVSLTGESTLVPVLDPPATATATPLPTDSTPGFILMYQDINKCRTTYFPRLKVKNSGGMTWSSYTMKVFDSKKNETVSYKSNDFINYAHCDVTRTDAVVQPGGVGFVGKNGGNFTHDLDNHTLYITVTLFEKDDLGGAWSTQTFIIKPLP